MKLRVEPFFFFRKDFLPEVEKQKVAEWEGGVVLLDFASFRRENEIGFKGSPLKVGREKIEDLKDFSGEFLEKVFDSGKGVLMKELEEEAKKYFSTLLGDSPFMRGDLIWVIERGSSTPVGAVREGEVFQIDGLELKFPTRFEAFVRNMTLSGKPVELRKGLEGDLKFPSGWREVLEEEFECYTLVAVRGGRILNVGGEKKVVDLEVIKYPLVLGKEGKVLVVKDYVNVKTQGGESPELLPERAVSYTLALVGESRILYVADVSLSALSWVERNGRKENVASLRYFFPRGAIEKLRRESMQDFRETDLKSFMDERFSGHEDYEKFKKLFPRMYEFAGKVRVIPWKDEFAVADRNPEVLDEIRFWEMLEENGLVSHEEARRRKEEAYRKAGGVVSKTLGIAFMESNEVSFREFPPLWIVLHELGHCYFKETDPIWSHVYGGGEKVMWLFIRGYFDPSAVNPEEAVRFWHSLVRGVWDESTRRKGKMLISRVARSVLGRDITKVDEELEAFGLPREDMYRYALWSGTILDKNERTAYSSFLVNVLEGTKYNDPFMERFAQELFRSETLKLWEGLLREEGPSPGR